VRGPDRDVVLACKRYLRAVRTMLRDARSTFALVEQTQFAASKHWRRGTRAEIARD
jgi:hypothetical protein